MSDMQEIEIKFYLSNQPALEQRLRDLGAELIHPRVHEVNLRFDTQDGILTRQRQVLRLRRDWRSVLTYKGPNELGQTVSVRKELEVVVSSFETTRRILEALGFLVNVTYEKYRTTYRWQKTLVELDEMPFGNFVEIEGPDAITIQSVASQLGLNWEARCLEGYLTLFRNLQFTRGLSARNLTFAEMEGRVVTAADMDITPADI